MKQLDMGRRGARPGILLVMFAAMTWGTVGVAAKWLYGMTVTNSLSIGFFRLGLAVPILFLLGWHTLGRRLFWVTRADLGWMLLMGGMTAIYQVCFYAAIAQTSITLATLVTLCTAPILVAVLSVWWGKEPLTRVVMLALSCAIGGTILLVLARSTLGANQSLLLGVLLACSSALCYAVVTLVSRRLAARCHPLQTVAISFTFGALCLLVCALGAGLAVTYSPLGWSLLIYLGVGPTAIAYALFLVGMRSTPALVASTATLLEPLTAAVLAWLCFGEQLNRLSILGALLLVGAMGLLLLDSRRT